MSTNNEETVPALSNSFVASKQYTFPKSAEFGRVVAKSKIFEHATPTSKVKNLFVTQIEKIIWAYKLSPTTINLPASDGVQEIQIFNVTLRTEALAHEVLQTIDRAIPSPILFILNYNEKYRYVAAYKRPSETDKDKWVTSSYFGTTEYTKTTEENKKELPIVLNMGGLYEALLKDLIALPLRAGETLGMLVFRMDQLQRKVRDIEKLEGRINKEKQFNRRVKLNRILNALKAAVRSLKDG